MSVASTYLHLDRSAAVTIAVAGAGGRVGRLLRAVWPADGAGRATRWSARRAEADVQGWDLCAAPPAGLLRGADVLLCLAGQTGATGGSFRNNANVALAALAAADAAGIGTVLLCSSVAVYGRSAGIEGGAGEDAPLRPVTAYGRSKMLMERAVTRDRRSSGAGRARAVVLRIGNVTGADSVSAGIAAAKTRGAAVALDCWPGGETAYRSVIGPARLAWTLVTLAQRAAAGGALPTVLNLSQPGAVTMADLCRAAGAEWRPQVPPPGALPRVTQNLPRLQALLPIPLPVADSSCLVDEWRAAGGL